MNPVLNTLAISHDFNDADLLKGTWLVILHASRVPPHIGIAVSGNYNSLNIKGQELDIPLPVLLKTIRQKKIETLFVQLVKHPVFSSDYQKEICQHHIKKFEKVDVEHSCLLPVKLFLQEFYALQFRQDELLFELVDRLYENNYVQSLCAFNIQPGETFRLPVYSSDELKSAIETENNQIRKIHVH